MNKLSANIARITELNGLHLKTLKQVFISSVTYISEGGEGEGRVRREESLRVLLLNITLH